MMLRYQGCRPSCFTAHVGEVSRGGTAGPGGLVALRGEVAGAGAGEERLAAGARVSRPAARWAAATGASEDRFGHGRLHNVGVPYKTEVTASSPLDLALELLRQAFPWLYMSSLKPRTPKPPARLGG
jgi:hypothetical protein